MYLSDEFRLKVGLAEMLKGGVIMDVTNVEQAYRRKGGGFGGDGARTRAVRYPQGRRSGADGVDPHYPRHHGRRCRFR